MILIVNLSQPRLLLSNAKKSTVKLSQYKYYKVNRVALIYNVILAAIIFKTIKGIFKENPFKHFVSLLLSLKRTRMTTLIEAKLIQY